MMAEVAHKHLILGGARSGKSAYAERLALQRGEQWYYLATGWAGDNEMKIRIAHHQQQRSAQWKLIEEPIRLASAMASIDHAGNVILIDCATLWLNNIIARGKLQEQTNALLEFLPQAHSDIYIVSNEVGSGIVPLGKLCRTFVDEAGRLNQNLAKICNRVTLITAGLPIELKK